MRSLTFLPSPPHRHLHTVPPQFVKVIQDSDGGAFARVIHKALDDQYVREDMRERIRPIQNRASVLEEQLASVRAERMWFTNIHALSTHDQVQAAKNGYTGETSVYSPHMHRPPGNTTDRPFAEEKHDESAALTNRSSPDRVSEKHLLPARSARRMLPDSELLCPIPSWTTPCSTPRGLAALSLRRVFQAEHAVVGSSPPTPRSMLSPRSPRSSQPPTPRRASIATTQAGGHSAFPPIGNRSISQPTRRPPAFHQGGSTPRTVTPAFHEGGVSPRMA